MNLTNKVALITGGCSGIGRETAWAMVRAGASVVVGDLDEQTGDKLIDGMQSSGGRAIFRKTDVTRGDEVQELIEYGISNFGRLDVAFNNAGLDDKPVALTDQTDANLASVFDVCVKGLYLSMKHEIAQMLQNGGGVIVNNCSLFGLNPLADWSSYIATKYAVTGMTKGAARSFAKKGIRVNGVGPGPILSPSLAKSDDDNPFAYAGFIPVGRTGRPEEIAAAVVWLCSDEASFVTGHIIPVDGGVWAS